MGGCKGLYFIAFWNWVRGGGGQKRAAKKVSKKKKLRGEVFRKVLSSSGSTLPVDGGAEEFPEIKADFFSSVQGRW